MIYLDSSFLIKCYVFEPGSAEVLNLVQGQAGLASAAHGRSEMRAGIHRHRREGRLTAGQTAAVWARVRADEAAGFWRWLPLDAAVVERACTVIEQLPATVFLRSADALHLACAGENGFREVYSNDRHLLAAAPHFGLIGRNVIS